MSDADTRTVELEPVEPPIDEVVDATTRKTIIILKRPRVEVLSFLGRPAEGGELAKQVDVARGGKVLLVWRTAGAKDVTISRRGKDGKRVVVKAGVEARGTLEVVADEADLRFTLEASAGDTLELDEVRVLAGGGSGLKIESFLGRPAAGGALAKEVTLALDGKAVLVWKAVGATDVTISRRLGKHGRREVVKTGLPLAGELAVVTDGAPDLLFTLEASEGDTNLEFDEVRVLTPVPPPPPPPPSGLRIESFLGRSKNEPQATPAEEVTLLLNEQLVLSWKVVGAREVTLVKHGPDKKRLVVARALKAEGELETQNDAEGLTFVLEASAGNQLELAEVKIDAALQSELIGRLADSFDQGSSEEVTIPRGRKLELAYRIKGAPTRVKLTVGKAEVLIDGTGPAEKILLRECPALGSFEVFLEATKGAQRTANLLTVTVVEPQPLPKIIAFDGAPRLEDDMVAFAWTIEGPFDKVILQPYGVDVTKLTTGGKGTAKVQWPLDHSSQFTLLVQLETFQTTASTTVKRPPDPPAPEVTGELLVRVLGSEEKPGKELKDLPDKSTLELFYSVKGPFKALTIQGVGPIAGAPPPPFGFVTVDPFAEKTLPDADGHYTLFADGKQLAQCKINQLAKAFVVPIEVGGEWETPKGYTLFKYVKVKLKGGIGLKAKAVFHGHPDGAQTPAAAKLKFNNKGPEISIELKRKIGIEGDVAVALTPKWVVSKVKKVERKDTPIKWNPKKGEVSVAAIKYEITFKAIEFEIGGHKTSIVPKLELEAVGLKFGKDKETGKPKRVAGALQAKLTGESNLIDQVLQKEFPLLHANIIEVVVFVSGGVTGEPDWEAIGRELLERVGLEGAMTIGLVLVAVGTVAGTIKGGLEWADIVNAPKQRGFALAFFNAMVKGLPRGLDDATAEDAADTVGPTPPTLGLGMDPEDRGRELGRWYRARSFAEYRAQTRGAQLFLAAAAEETSDPDGAAREKLREDFRAEWVEKRRLIEFRLKKQLWDDIRRLAYLRFREESHGTPDAMDSCFRSLYMEPPRQGFDYDFPEVDDDLFELAMKDQLEGSGALSRPMLLQAWKDAGYFLTPPDAADRHRKQQLRKQPSSAPTTAIDISSGTLMRTTQSMTRDEAVSLLKDRGLVFTGKSDKSLQDLVVRLGWLETFTPGHVFMCKGPEDPKVVVRCMMRMLDPKNPRLAGYFSTSEALLALHSSDHGSEFIEVSVHAPSYVRPEGDERP